MSSQTATPPTYSSPVPPPPPPSGAEALLHPSSPSPFLDEKRHPGEAHLHNPHTPSSEGANAQYGFFTPVVSAIARIHSLRKELGLPNPGTVEHLQREVKATHLTNHFFDGARADLTKVFSTNPVFQVTHAFSFPIAPNPAGYNFGAVVGDERHFLQGGVDDSGAVTMRFNRGWGAGHTSKAQAQLVRGPGSFVQLEHDYQGSDHSANVKALNPGLTDGTGIFMVNYIQSLTRNFALGIETVVQRPSPEVEEASTGYHAKYVSNNHDWIATASMQGVGILQATYWQKLAERIDVAADLILVAVGQKREATATLGAKWDFRMSTLRGQIDSTGKISSLFEQRLAPTFSFTVGGEIDHLKSTSRFGVGFNIESGGEGMDPTQPPPAPPSLPL
ncbi:hypothetical protein K437DRAFT_276886 [Tilletiaria anomala UBC 951]|uniref:Uncharacterized protein n=1 Tax=Tilletiaria anomala (strain ATCC 24038 / CBS 436.72 / UBC 951) TaxID=1037660 RepID=A0A066V312_TILAU|nr:uncharacterized protein K437DRAFT_276886 [Tilletiaria anomala UBC 951]KDN36097.1 hypothetical protein K437DRAFT_276886 [Tilletiaria anomala UBC 951]